MIDSPGSFLDGVGDVAAVRRRLVEGDPPVLVLCGGAADLLTRHSRELVRELRANGARVEFHAPGDADTVLLSANRLLADMPLDCLSPGSKGVMRVLVIDAGESLGEQEVASLRRLVNGLVGSALRVVVLVGRTIAAFPSLPVSALGPLAVVWDIDGPRSVAAPPPVAFARPMAEAVPLADPGDSGEQHEPLDDVLAELARERAGAAVPDREGRRRSNAGWYAVLALIAAVAGTLVVLQWRVVERVQTSALVYECGLHPDLESTEILTARLGTAVPVRIREQSGGYRLQAGPFASKAAAEAARPRVWPIGACGAKPIAPSPPVDASLTKKNGG